MLTLTVFGGTLFDVASRSLGDATRWSELATLNNIDDPWLVGIVTLLLPSTGKAGLLAIQ